MKTTDEIRAQIKALDLKRRVIPDGVKPGEEEAWSEYCLGGISALYWVLKEDNPYTHRKTPEWLEREGEL